MGILNSALAKGWSSDQMRDLLKEFGYSNSEISNGMNYYDYKKKSQDQAQAQAQPQAQAQAQTRSQSAGSSASQSSSDAGSSGSQWEYLMSPDSFKVDDKYTYFKSYQNEWAPADHTYAAAGHIDYSDLILPDEETSVGNFMEELNKVKTTTSPTQALNELRLVPEGVETTNIQGQLMAKLNGKWVPAKDYKRLAPLDLSTAEVPAAVSEYFATKSPYASRTTELNTPTPMTSAQIMRQNFSGAQGQRNRENLEQAYYQFKSREVVNASKYYVGKEDFIEINGVQYKPEDVTMDMYPPLFIEHEMGADVGGGVKEVLNPEAIKLMFGRADVVQARLLKEQEEYEEELREDGEAWWNNLASRFLIKGLSTMAVSADWLATGGGYIFPETELGQAGRAGFAESGRLRYAEKLTTYGEERANMSALENLSDGTFEGFKAGLMMMGEDYLLEQVPNYIIIAATEGAALPYLGLMSGTESYSSVYDNPNWTQGEKLGYGVIMGATEYFTEKVFNSDIKAAQSFMSKRGVKSFGTEASRKELGDIMFGALSPGKRAMIEEGFEEAIVATVDEIYAAAVEGREINKFEIAESALAGAVGGGGIHVAARGWSSVGKIANLQTKYTLRNNIANISNLVNDPSISEKEKEILRDKLVDYHRQAAEIENDAYAFYSQMTRRDVNSIIKLNQEIKQGLSEYQSMKTEEGKAEAAKKVKAAVAKKSRIENKYDSKTEQQVSSDVQEGATVKQGQPVFEAGTKKTKAGRVFQTTPQAIKTAEAVLGYPKSKLKSIKVNNNNVNEALSFLIDGVNQMSEKVFEATKTNKRSVLSAINSIENVVKTLTESGAEVEIVAHVSGKSFNKATGEEGSARAMHITKDGEKNQIHILVPAVMSNTIYHEAIHELIPNVMGSEGVSKVAKKLRNIIKEDPILSKYMSDFEAQYGTEAKDAEFMAEISSLIADGSIAIDVKRGVAAKFIEAINDALGKVFNIKPTNGQLIEAMNYMANQLATGQAVEYQEKTAEPPLTEDGYRYIEDMPLTDNSAEPGDVMASGVMSSDDVKQAQKMTFSPISFDVNAYTEMKGANLVFPKSQTDMKSALEKSGGAWVIINSDATGVGTTQGGTELYGGIGFTFIEQNIKDKIGFAASTDNKVTELSAKIARTAETRDVFHPEHKGKPVTVFVMVQSPGAAFGNHYGANFLADALYETVKQGVMTQEQVKEQFNEYADNQINLAQGLADARIEKGKNASKELGKIAKFNLIKTAVNEADLSTKKGHDSIQKLVSSDNKIDFGTRREFIEGFIPNVSKTKGPGGELRSALIDLGFNMPNFIDTYLDKNLSSQLVGKNQTDRNKDGGYIVSGFYVENPTDTDSFIEKSKAGTFVHPQFNAKFHGQDPFLLNGKYYVNQIFKEQGYKSKTVDGKTGAPKEISVATSVAGSMYVSSEYTPGSGLKFIPESTYLDGIRRIEERIAQASESKVQYQKGDSPDFASRYKDVKTSNMNTYGVSTSIFTDIQNMLNDKEGVVQLLDEKDLYLPVSRQDAGDKDKSYYMSFTAYSKKLKKKVSVDIRVADHTVPLSETTRSKEFNESGYYKRSRTGDKVLSVALNIWNKPTQLEAKRRLEMYGFQINKVDPEYFMYNNRTFKQQKFSLYNNLVDLLDKYTTVNEEGNNVLGIEQSEFVEIAEMLGMSAQAAKQMYDEQLSNKLGHEGKRPEGSEIIESIYDESIEALDENEKGRETLLSRLKVGLTDRQAKVKKAIVKAGLDNVRELLVNRAGAAAYARYIFNKWDSKIYGGMELMYKLQTVAAQKAVDQIVFLRRVIQIDSNVDGRRRMADFAVSELKSEYAAWLQENLNNISTAAKKKDKDYKSRIAALEKAASEIVRPLHPNSKKHKRFAMNKEEAERQLRALEAKWGNKKYNDLYRRSDVYFDSFRSLLKSMYDEGLVSQESYEALIGFNYQPRMFLQHVYDVHADAGGKIGMRDYGLSQKQIKEIKSGSNQPILMDSRFILNLYARSVTSRIAKNKANRALAEGLLDKKNNDWIRPSNEGKSDDGFETVYFYENGEQKSFQLSEDLKQEWDDVAVGISSLPRVARGVSMVTGSAPLKLFATRANPLFVLRNLPRDFGHILFLTDVYDKHNIYYGSLLLTRDFFRGLTSKITDNSYYQDYMRLGGGMDFLSTEGRRKSVARNLMGRITEGAISLASAPGEASEIGFRLGVYKRLVDDGVKKHKKEKGEAPTGEDLERIKIGAVTKAREIIDFAQGGQWTKGAEIVTPYINSAFQGFRVSTEYIAKNPVKFARKLTEMTFGLTALLLYNLSVGEDEWEHIPDETKKRYHIIFTPFTYTDEQGRTRRRYIKVAKTQQMAPFYAVSEVVAAEVASEVYGKTIKASSDDLDYALESLRMYLPKDPMNPGKEIMSAIPVISMVNTYYSNYDSFRDQKISLEYDSKNPPPASREGLYDPSIPVFYKAIGDALDISPARMQVAVEKVITGPNSSALVGGTYHLLNEATKQYWEPELKYSDASSILNAEEFKGGAWEGILKMGSIGTTNPDWKQYNREDEFDAINQQSSANRQELRNLAKEYAEEYKAATNDSERKAAIDKAKQKGDEVYKENESDAIYFRDTFKDAAKTRSTSKEMNEIIYAADHNARARIINLILKERGDESLQGFKALMSELAEANYRIPVQTGAEYELLYGKPK